MITIYKQTILSIYNNTIATRSYICMYSSNDNNKQYKSLAKLPGKTKATSSHYHIHEK